MKYSELILYYQENLLTEKDVSRSHIGFDGIGKMSRADTKHMNVTTTKDKNVYLPYNELPRRLSNAANQALKRAEYFRNGRNERITPELANEILINYDAGSTASLEENTPKQLNSKSPISIVKINGNFYLQA